MLGLNPYVLLGGAIFIALLTGGAYVKGRVDAGKKYEKQIGGLELANQTFATQQAAMQVEAIKTAAKIEEAEKITAAIANAKQDTIIRINQTPIGPGCESAMQFLRDEAVRAQAARKKFNESRPR